MDQYTRRIVGFAVHVGNVDGPALCRMFNDATSSQGWPKYLSSDKDPLFQYHRGQANLRVVPPVNIIVLFFWSPFAIAIRLQFSRIDGAGFGKSSKFGFKNPSTSSTYFPY